MDLKTGKQYPIQSFITLRPDAYNPDVNLGILAYYLKAAENVFLIDNDFIVALVPDFRTFPNSNSPYAIKRTGLNSCKVA